MYRPKSSKARGKYCPDCKPRKDITEGVEGVDYLTCPVCNKRVKEFTIGHVKMHGFSSLKEFKNHHDLEYLKCSNVRDNMKGENNPAYNHGGKYSPFSENFINGYDEEWHRDQCEKHSELMKKSTSNTFSINHWIELCQGDEQKAAELHSEYQTRDLDFFVNKYGEEEGKIRHQQKIDRWIESFYGKSEEDMLEINRKKLIGLYESKPEGEILKHLSVIFPNIISQYPICRGYVDGRTRYYMYDFKLDNKIVEFNGDIWHANPSLFDESFINPINKMTYEEIHIKERDKMRLAEENNFEVFVVWEYDFKKDKQKVIQQCIDFLTQ